MGPARHLLPLLAMTALVVGGCAGAESGSDSAGADPRPSTAADTAPVEPTHRTDGASRTTADTAPKSTHGGDVNPDALLPAYLGAAAYQDVAVAEAAGWTSTIDSLGCFENPDRGGMGVHWLNDALLDADLDPANPEALVYELDADGDVVGLVGHEYLVPIDAWTGDKPPKLFGRDFHKHPVLPFWILHAYLWKDNPSGMFTDWNPSVRMCPDGVTVFGADLAAVEPDSTRSAAQPS